MNKKIFSFPQSLISRRSFGAALMIFIAVYLSRQLSFTEEFWITTTAMLVMQTAVGLTARQGLQRFMIIVLSMLITTAVIFYLQDKLVIDVVAIVLFSFLCYFSLAAKVNRPQVVIPLMIGIVALIAMVVPLLPFDILKLRTIDVATGGVIGFLAGLLILPVRADVEFRKEAVPLLNATADYLSTIIGYLFDHSLEKELLAKKIQLEQVWENFPDWVYEVGFTAMLQQGHRHFLVRIEEIRQILFTLNYLARHNYDKELLDKFYETMQSYELKMKKLIQDIVMVLTSQTIMDDMEDLSEAFEKLEKKFKTFMPYSLEMLEINPDYVYLANFIFELKELGKMLIILARALR